MLHLIERIGGISIATQENLWPARADAPEHFEVPSGLAFHLDAAIACIQFRLDFFQELLDRVLYSYRNATGYLLLRATQQLPQGNILDLGLSVPESIFQCSFGHAMAAHPRKQRSPVTPLCN